MSAIDKQLAYNNQMDDYQQELVLAFVTELFDLDIND